LAWGEDDLQRIILMSVWSKRASKQPLIAAALTVQIASSASQLVFAQDQQGQQQSPQQIQQQTQQQPLTQQQLQQLVAPIALYPDALLAQVLTASTYPLEVAMAARWSEKNPDLKGPALEDAMQKEQWDPSVKGLTAVPQVLAMMNEKLDWSNQLGEAFLAQPNDVQTAIQALRKQADATGSLKSSKEQKVSKVAAPPGTGYAGPPEYFVIEPVEPDYIYVPVYDPVVVYGPGYWPPAYVPFFWYPRWWVVGPAFGFGAALFVGPALWCHYNWGHPGYAAIQTNTALYSKFNRVSAGGAQFQNWKFDPAHHGNVQFKNSALQQQFGNIAARGGQGQIGKNIQGIQSGLHSQGVQSGKTLQGIQGAKNVSSTQLNKGAQNFQATKGVQNVKTGKSVQGIQTNRVQGIQGSKHIQTGNRAQVTRTANVARGAPKGKGNNHK
jgi:hypothetical protein